VQQLVLAHLPTSALAAEHLKKQLELARLTPTVECSWAPGFLHPCLPAVAETASGKALALGRVLGSLCVLTAKDGDAQGAMLASWVSQVSAP